MKIAVLSLFTPAGVAGGVALQAHYLSNEFVRRGHDVHVYTLFPPACDASYTTHIVTLPKVWRFFIKRLMGIAMLVFPWYVAREDWSKYDIVYAVGDSHFVKPTRPIVRTFHSSGLDQALYATTLRRAFGMMAVYPFEVWSGFRATERVFVSRNAMKYFPFRRKRLIYNAVDLTLFQPGCTKSSVPSILFVAGTLLDRKRGKLLVDVFQEQVLPQIPNAELWMVCKERIAARGVRWFGLLSGHELAQKYKDAWVFCLPSSHETFGVPYVEAMACGTPVIATPNDGAREVLGDGLYGIIVEADRLGKALAALLRDRIRREEMAARGLARARNFDLAAVSEQYEELFEQLVGRPGRPNNPPLASGSDVVAS